MKILDSNLYFDMPQLCKLLLCYGERPPFNFVRNLRRVYIEVPLVYAVFLSSLRPLVPRSNGNIVFRCCPPLWKLRVPYRATFSPIMTQEKNLRFDLKSLQQLRTNCFSHDMRSALRVLSDALATRRHATHLSSRMIARARCTTSELAALAGRPTPDHEAQFFAF